jgi:hypothetical protein
MLKIQDALMLKIKNEILPSQFGLMFDGWTDSNIHYIAIYAVVPEFQPVLLSFSPFPDEENLSASSYNDAWDETLKLYGKDSSHIMFIIGDNCNVNIKAADIYGVPFIGCASHRLNLAIKMWLDEFSTKRVLDKINELSKKLRSIKGKAFLKRIKVNNAKIRNVTRWSSVYLMVERYLNIFEAINKSDNVPEDILSLLLSPIENVQVSKLFQTLKKFESVNKFLQKRSTTMLDVRILFDNLLEEFPMFEKYLSPNSKIVKSPDLESGICKLQNNQKSSLTESEKEEIKWLIKETRNIDEFDYAVRIVKRQRLKLSTKTHRGFPLLQTK